MEAMSDNQRRATPSTGSSAGHAALRELQENPSLIDLVDPLMKDVIKGLSGMTKIVGTGTPTQVITPEVLAAAVAVKQRCEKEVLLPLLEIKEHVKLRLKELEIMYANQLSQLKTLKEHVKKLMERRHQIEEKAAIVKTNATSLAQRSTSALESSTDLLPTITQAEYDYFKYLKALNAKLVSFERELDRLKLTTSALTERDSRFDQNAAPADLKNMSAVLKGTETMLRDSKQKIRGIEDTVDDLNIAVGVDRISIMGSPQ
jgi:archaellum component FlaC